MANFNIPNLCGASPELNAASLKIESLENEITAKLDAAASDAAAAFNTALTDVKAGLDGLALDLPEVPNVNFQSELTSLINDIDKTTIEGIAAFNNKLAELEKDFGNTLKEKGLGLDKLVTDATSKLATGGDVCALAPNIEIPAANSGSLTAARDDNGSDTSEVCPSNNSNATSSPFNAKQHLIFISTYDYDNPPLNAVSKRMALGPPPKKRRRSVLASSESKVPHLAAVANSDSDKLCFSTESTPESNKQALLKEKLYSNKLLEDDSAHK